MAQPDSEVSSSTPASSATPAAPRSAAPPPPEPAAGAEQAEQAGQAGPASPRTMLSIIGAILVAVLLVAVIVAIATSVTHRGSATDSQGRKVDHVVTGAVNGRDAATIDVVSGSTSVTVRGADLGDRLYRVSTPDDSNLAPAVVDANDTVQVQLNSVGGNGASAVVIELNRSVRWTVRLTAGATSESLDLGDIKVAGVEFVGGATSIDLTLGKPTATVPVRMGGGANRFAIHLPAGVPVRVSAGGGAGSITIDGVQHSGISAGASFTSTAWDTTTDRYDVTNAVGVGSALVDRTK